MHLRLLAIAVFATWLPSVQAAPLTFSDQTAAAGLIFEHAQSIDHRSGPMSGGGAVGDFNGDGYPDIYAIGGGNAGDALFINNGDSTFTERSGEWRIDAPHRGVGATVGDYDGDGDDDLYVTSFGPMDQIDGPGRHLLYRNEGDHFVEMAAFAGVATTTAGYPDGYGSAFGDYDRDGDLDLFVGAWHNVQARGTRLFRNEGDGTFSDVSDKAGIITGGTHAFAGVWADMNDDRYPELLVAGDFGTNRYYRNNGDGSFQELDPGTGLPVATEPLNWSIGKAHNGMGTTVADFNRDGLPDWFITAIWPTFSYAVDFWGNGLYINHGDHIFTEVSAGAGVNDGGWGWGVSAVDLNNDTWTDLVMTNGWQQADPVTGATFDGERAYLWLNRGNLTFEEVGVAAGLTHSGQGRALLHLDYDRDGDIDIVILSHGEPLQLFRNELIGVQRRADAQWLQVRLDTSGNPALAPHGAGATIIVEAGGERQWQQVTLGGTYLGQSELVAHFGLGKHRKIKHLTVYWGNGKKTRLHGLKAGRRIVVHGPCPPRAGDPISAYAPVTSARCSGSGTRPHQHE